MNVEFLTAAQDELAEAVAYYDSQQRDLGARFLLEVKRTIERILQYPKAWSPISKRTRRCRVSGFPYGVIYQTRGSLLLIVAVMHLHRDPKSWRSRLHKGEQ